MGVGGVGWGVVIGVRMGVCSCKPGPNIDWL